MCSFSVKRKADNIIGTGWQYCKTWQYLDSSENKKDDKCQFVVNDTLPYFSDFQLTYINVNKGNSFHV